jgi:hypothetical protein
MNMVILHFLRTLFACLLAAMRRTLSFARRRPERTQRDCIVSKQRHKYLSVEGPNVAHIDEGGRPRHPQCSPGDRDLCNAVLATLFF